MSNTPKLRIDNIKVFTANTKHKGDYFLITDNDLTLWVKDPHGLLKTEKSNIVALHGELGVEQDGRKKIQVLNLVDIEFEGSYSEAIPSNAAPYVPVDQFNVRPDYSGWSDEAIARDIMDRRKEKERREGNSFVKFRKAVTEVQKERHKALLHEIKLAKKNRTVPDVEEYEIDDSYMPTLRKETSSLELKLGHNAMIGDGLGRLDGAPAYDANKDLEWGTPPAQ